jgi:hypothetical protein
MLNVQAPDRPRQVIDLRAPALAPRGATVLAILRTQDLVRELDGADREHSAPYVADLLVDLCTDALPA